MTMSFRAQLIDEAEHLHLYRVDLEGGTRVAHFVLDEKDEKIFESDSSGHPRQGGVLSIASGEFSSPPKEGEGDEGGFRREDFKSSAAHVAYQWKKEGRPPAEVIKYFG
ncbi:hypothetical protein [Streptomyces sp. ST2-7A]|uniref:hypothetical protein n=1 Tax=Streptomyces sp. ST2-7A TaxID=2907214 RepID=UPI001F3CFF41|nr:hypothetical protein [Streptomyces sp. ST2-7A]MCE7082313.1 hypothetical protein [Streptomyces sp. ST2-7A]